MHFMGYKRPYGRCGVRNHVVVMPGVLCSTIAAKRIVSAVSGTTLLENPYGCGQINIDMQRTLEVISGLIANPNVYSALIVGLGCESIQKDAYLTAIQNKAPGKRVEYISIQEDGFSGSITKGIDIALEMVNDSLRCTREECDLSELMLGLECGGSDPTSGISANAALGIVSNKLINNGGTTVISETTEAIGVEHILKNRGATEEIGDAIYQAIMDKDELFKTRGEDIRDSNPSPGNKRGGLTTLEEKSLGCIHKCGSTPFTGYVECAKPVTMHGNVFMETGAYDAASTASEIAGGCQIVAFTTGLGNPMGNAIAPVFKITGNRNTANKLFEFIDFDTSDSIYGIRSLEEVADSMLKRIIDVASGQLVKAELLHADVMSIDQQNPGM